MHKIGSWEIVVSSWSVNLLGISGFGVWKGSEQFVSSLVIRRGRSSTERMKHVLFGMTGSVKPCNSTPFPQTVYSYVSTSIIALNTSVVHRLFRTFPPTYYNYYEVNK